MGSRKSLGHALLEETNSLASSPLRRRSVLAQKEPPDTIDIVNDDNTERAGNRRSLLLTGVARMSLPQIKEGIAECIKLNTQNKINIKNAFSLSMIDFMEFMVKSRDEGISNLQVASTTLDVSAKIYGLRVDSLHHDTLKMIGHLDNQSKDDSKQTNDDNDSNLNTTVGQERPKKKRKASQKILVSIESLQGKCEKVSLEPPMFGDADCQTTDMLYQVMLPKHCGRGINLHPYRDVLFDNPSITEIEEDDSEIPNIDSWQRVENDGTEEMSGMFEDFEFLNWNADDTESLTSSQETRVSDANESMAFDMDASFHENVEGNYDGRNFFDIHDDDQEETQVAQFQVMNRVPEKIVDVVEVIENIVSKRFEYSYFNENLNILQAGPSQWTVKNPVNRLAASRVIGACRQDGHKRRKEFHMEFDDETMNRVDDKFRVPKANIHRVNKKTAQNGWLEEKILLGPRDAYDIDQALKYKLRPDDYFPLQKGQEVKKEAEENGRTAFDDIGNDSIGNDDFGGADDNIDHDNHVDNGDHHMDGDVPNSDGEIFSQGGFVGDNLVEAPKLTEKIYIPFSQRAKKLDMRNLKRSIWRSLNSGDGEKENVGNDVADAIKNIKEFSDVFIHLPEKLNKNDASELTFPIAFVSLLHLANEKNLRILSKNNYSDLTVFEDIP